MSRKTALMEQTQKIGDIIELNDLFDLILNNVYSGIIFCDSDSRILFMNQVYADLPGTDRDQAVGQHIIEKITDGGFVRRSRRTVEEKCHELKFR